MVILTARVAIGASERHTKRQRTEEEERLCFWAAERDYGPLSFWPSAAPIPFSLHQLERLLWLFSEREGKSCAGRWLPACRSAA
jgi:hypothetical protein